MKYKVGDKVIVTEEGVNKGLVATITDRRNVVPGVKIPSTPYIYYASLEGSEGRGYKGTREIVVTESMIKPFELTGDKEEDKCTCGGDFLTIPHHYDWCAKGNNNDKINKNN